MMKPPRTIFRQKWYLAIIQIKRKNSPSQNNVIYYKSPFFTEAGIGETRQICKNWCENPFFSKIWRYIAPNFSVKQNFFKK